MALVQAPGAVVLQQTAHDRLRAMAGNASVGRQRIWRALFLAGHRRRDVRAGSAADGAGSRAGVSFILFLVLTVTPLLALGATVMTVDPLSVLFWTAAMVVGWRAAQPDGTTRQWLWVGLWTGLGCLSKWTNLLQPACWGLFFLLWPEARRHVRRPGPYLALLITPCSACRSCSGCSNISGSRWNTSLPTANWTNRGHRPLWVNFWGRNGRVAPDFLCGGVVGGSGVLAPGPSRSVPAFAVQHGRAVVFRLFLFELAQPRAAQLDRALRHSAFLPDGGLLVKTMGTARRHIATAAGVWSGVRDGPIVVILHDPNLVNKIVHRRLPPKYDLLHRAHGWKEMARIVGQARQELAAQGPPAFIIAEHYGFTSQLSFYLPEAKREVNSEPLVYFLASAHPINQFYYWPNYLHRTGQNALFVREVAAPALRQDWFSRWWHQDPDIFEPGHPQGGPPPPAVLPIRFLHQPRCARRRLRRRHCAARATDPMPPFALI
jgi:hypothetical protein